MLGLGFFLAIPMKVGGQLENKSFLGATHVKTAFNCILRNMFYFHPLSVNCNINGVM